MRAQVCRISVCSLDLWAHSLQQNKTLRQILFMFNVYSRVSFGQREGAQSLAALYEGRSGLTRQGQQPSGSRTALCWSGDPALPLATLRPAAVTQAGLIPSEKGKPTFRAGLATTNSPKHTLQAKFYHYHHPTGRELSPKKFKGFSRVMESVGSRARIESLGLDPEHSAMEPSFVC